MCFGLRADFLQGVKETVMNGLMAGWSAVWLRVIGKVSALLLDRLPLCKPMSHSWVLKSLDVKFPSPE